MKILRLRKIKQLVQEHTASKKWSQCSKPTPRTYKVCVQPLGIVLFPRNHPLLDEPLLAIYLTLFSLLALSACLHFHNHRVPVKSLLCLPDPLVFDPPQPHRTILQGGWEGQPGQLALGRSWIHLSGRRHLYVRKNKVIGFNLSPNK